MPLANLETPGVARCLAQIADRPGDHADVFFELSAEERCHGAVGSLVPESRFEQGLAVRLLRGGRQWLATSDEISPAVFADAVARVARARPGAVAPAPGVLAAEPIEEADPAAGSLAEFIERVEAAIKRRHAAFPIRWDLRRHARWTRVIGTMLVPPQQSELFYSCAARLRWDSWGTLLLQLDDAAVISVADSLTRSFRARAASPPAAGETTVVLGPSATAVLLHEAVAHTLETDTLALTGNPVQAKGVELAAKVVSVLDDPAGAPTGVARTVDDEGMPILKRWLLRNGVVGEPLADLDAARRSADLISGAARRGSRHLPPVPRSTHLELLPGTGDSDEIIAGCRRGLYIDEFSRGNLDALSGELRLAFSVARRIDRGVLGAVTGGGRVHGTAAGLLGAVRQIGADVKPGGAGWCAKGGHRLPVWASAPSVLLERVEVGP